jgi:glycosyltransferase involved in cell wall biosynthesis
MGSGKTFQIVSVVAATHNRAPHLERMLAGLRAQTTPPDEVVITDDGSTDATAAVLERESAREGLAIRVISRSQSAGPATARESAWREASGDLIAFIDDDCVPEEGWIAAGAQASEANPDCFIQGRTEPDPKERGQLGPYSHTIEVTQLDPSFPTCNMFYPRTLLERIGGFDTETFGRAPGGEDCDLAWRAIAAGAEPRFAPEALVHHAVVNLGPIGKLRLAARWTVPMTAYARNHDLRRAAFTHGIFWKDIHYYLFRAALGLALPARWSPIRNWLMYPYLQDIWARGRLQGGGLLLAPFYVLHDLVEIGAVARAGIRERKLML